MSTAARLISLCPAVTDDSASVIKFSVDKDKEAAFRQTTAEWLEPQLPGARLIGPKWYPVKADWIEVPLAMDAETGKVSQSAMERFGTENGVEVCTMRWLGRPRPSGQHASVVIKAATKEDAEKLLKSDSVTFGGGGIIMSTFEERRLPVACFKCRRFGHRARDCMRLETCDMCGQEGHLQCETTNLRCVNCQGPHRASHRECPEYRKEKARILTRQRHGKRTPDPPGEHEQRQRGATLAAQRRGTCRLSLHPRPGARVLSCRGRGGAARHEPAVDQVRSVRKKRRVLPGSIVHLGV